MSKLVEAFIGIVKRIRDEKLLWLLGVLVLAVIAGFRDWIIFIAVLVVGLLVILLGLISQRSSNMQLAINFKDKDAAEIQLQKCEFELFDSQNNLKRKGEMAFAMNVNSWVCNLPKETKPDDIIRIVFTERNGVLWETGPFWPLFNSKEAEQVIDHTN